jgi:hypothetical protein
MRSSSPAHRSKPRATVLSFNKLPTLFASNARRYVARKVEAAFPPPGNSSIPAMQDCVRFLCLGDRVVVARKTEKRTTSFLPLLPSLKFLFHCPHRAPIIYLGVVHRSVPWEQAHCRFNGLVQAIRHIPDLRKIILGNRNSSMCVII